MKKILISLSCLFIIVLASCNKKVDPVGNGQIEPLNSSAKKYTMQEVDNDFNELSDLEEDLWDLDITFQYSPSDEVIGINVFPSSVFVSERIQTLQDFTVQAEKILTKYGPAFVIADGDILIQAQLKGEKKILVERKRSASLQGISLLNNSNGRFKPTLGDKGEKPKKFNADDMLDEEQGSAFLFLFEKIKVAGPGEEPPPKPDPGSDVLDLKNNHKVIVV